MPLSVRRSNGRAEADGPGAPRARRRSERCSVLAALREALLQCVSRYFSVCNSRVTTLSVKGVPNLGWSATAVSSYITVSDNSAVKAAMRAGSCRGCLQARSSNSQRKRGWAGSSWKREGMGLWKSFAIVSWHWCILLVLEDKVMPECIPCLSNAASCRTRNLRHKPGQLFVSQRAPLRCKMA